MGWAVKEEDGERDDGKREGRQSWPNRQFRTNFQKLKKLKHVWKPCYEKILVLTMHPHVR